MQDFNKKAAFKQAARIWSVVQAAGNRAMAADGPVGPEENEVSEKEWIEVTKAAKSLLKTILQGQAPEGW